MSVVQDPQGAVFMLWHARNQIGAGLVNAPGALTLNQLNTSDPEAPAGSTRTCWAGPCRRWTCPATTPTGGCSMTAR